MDQKEDVLSSFAKISDKISTLDYVKNSPNLKGKECRLYLMGGAALYLNGVKPGISDVDWFIQDQWLKHKDIDLVRSNAGKMPVDIQTAHLTEGFTPDYHYNSTIVTETNKNGFSFQLRAVSPEMVFVKKIDMGRDKDIADLDIIAAHTTPEKIVDALNACVPLNSYEDISNIVSQTLSEINCLYFLMCSPKEIIAKNRELIKLLEVDESIKSDIANSFGINPSSVRNDHKDPWSSTTPKQSYKPGSFDL